MPVEMTHGVTGLSADGMRERAFRRELELIAQRERQKAAWQRKRAARCRVGSNGRRKALQKARELEEHAETLLAATVDQVAA